MVNEINPVYLTLFTGEALENEQVEAVFKDCMPEENEDGEIKYARKYPLHTFHSNDIVRVFYTCFKEKNLSSYCNFHMMFYCFFKLSILFLLNVSKYRDEDLF